MEEKAISPLFYNSKIALIQDNWNQVQVFFSLVVTFFIFAAQLAPQAAIILIMTLFLFLFKITYYFYLNCIDKIPEKNGFLSFNNFLNEISKIRNLEKI